MKRAGLGLLVVTTIGIAALVGCAVGDTGEDIGESDLTTLTVEAGDENSVVLQPPSEGEDAGTDEDEDAGDTDAATNVDAGTDGGTSTPDGGTVTSCASPNTCLGATDLGSVSGDTGAGTKTAQGATSQWFKIRLTEDDNSVFGTKLGVKADLVSPAGMNFDLFIYRANDGSSQECSAVTTSSTSTSTTDSASNTWGEGSISNGSDDGRTVTVEVRYVSGTCSPTSKWTLSVRGNP